MPQALYTAECTRHAGAALGVRSKAQKKALAAGAVALKWRWLVPSISVCVRVWEKAGSRQQALENLNGGSLRSVMA
ncbi:hypothetical protein GUJ93_ZPchr0015g6710 [Zizania palustris]|uniref:Uncharacterized protein n=1 Tax=Zizania palustris TaxID=103762 RepID=A0A8J5SYC5_ZIZPA|nr:hypothetical protein GUJ93_ZPchr0015g6710 [Zizania palustris]